MNNKMLTKLVSVALMLVISLIMVVMTTYAWLTMSGNPEVQGIQVAIGGTNTIMIAPDIVSEYNGQTVHYPGLFNDKLDFSRAVGYEYLGSLTGLAPYSTADGVNWFYADYSDSELSSGQLLSIDELPLDDKLLYANISSSEDDGSTDGCYVYIDFWVVSPIDNCVLRVTTGDIQGGSFVMDMKSLEVSDSDGDGINEYALKNSIMPVSSSVRVGFLVNNYTAVDGSMESYLGSSVYCDKYSHLLGIYQEKGESCNADTTFMIYEPNCDVHADTLSYVYTGGGLSSKSYSDGGYVITNPIGLVNGTVTTVDIRDILTVQKAGSWVLAENGKDDMIDQVFEGYLFGKSEPNEASLLNEFYGNYLQYKYASYITCGSFIKNTVDLYNASGIGGVVDNEDFDRLASATATVSTSITTLQRNVPQRIRMYIWIEGQDVDCVNGASGNNFAVNLKLAGGNS